MDVQNLKTHTLAIAILVGLSACGGGGGEETAPPAPPPPPPTTNLPALSIGMTSAAEGDTGTSDLSFEITLSAAATGDVTVEYQTADGTAESGSDYVASNGVVTIVGGSTQALISVPINGELCFEADESFSVTLSNISANASLATGSATGTGTITNDDQKSVISIADSELVEGDSGSSNMPFVISLDQPGCVDTSANFTSNIVTADAVDFVVGTNGFVVPAGATQTTVNVEIAGDTFYETDETLNVNLEDLPTDIDPGDIEAFGTIRTDDLPPVILSRAEVTEGDSVSKIMTFQVALAGITNDVSVDYATSDLTATVADNDYTPQSGTLSFPAGTTDASIQVEIIGDTAPENNEDLRLTLTNLLGEAVLIPGSESVFGTILDDDTPIVPDPTVTPSAAATSEGDSGLRPVVFDFSVNTPVTNDIVIDYATSDISATAGVDYNSSSGRLRIPAGETQATVSVDIRGDTDEEQSEYFSLNLTLVAGNVTLFTPRVTGTILDDDVVGPSVLEIHPTSIFEGDSGRKDMLINVTLNPAVASAVAIDYATRDVTALAGSDYGASSGTINFAAGETVKTIAVPVLGDTFVEAHEAFDVELSNLTGSATVVNLPLQVYAGVIETDDPFAMISIDDVGQFEGDTGTTDMIFTVSIDAAAADPVTMDYMSMDPVGENIAIAGEDYTAVSGSVSIPAGDTQTTISVQVNGDLDNEFDEPFNIALNNVSQNAEFETDTGTGRIVNDDGSPGWGIPQALDQDSQNNILPKVSMNANGAAMAVWASTTAGAPYESSRYDPAGGWANHDLLLDNFTSQHFDVFVNDTGDTTLAWTFSRAAYATHTVNGGWTPGTEFEPASLGGQDAIHLAGNDSGEIIALWEEPFTTTPNAKNVSYSRYDPAVDFWGTLSGTVAEVLAEGQFVSQPHIDMSDNGDAVAVWRDTQTWASRFSASGGSWSTPEIITNELFPGFFALGYHPRVAFDDNGNAIAVWDDFLGIGVSGVGNIWASRYDAATDSWEEAIQLETVNLDATHPRIAMDTAGNAFVVWLQDNNAFDFFNDSFEIWGRRYDASTATWEAETLIHDSGTRISQFGFQRLPDAVPLDMPKLAVDSAGNALLVWSENINGEFFIRASRYDITDPTSGWGPPENISGTAYPHAIFPEIDVDATGNGIVVWQAGDNELFQDTDIAEIWTNRYTAP